MNRVRSPHRPWRALLPPLGLVCLLSGCAERSGDWVGSVDPPDRQILRAAFGSDPVGLDPTRYNDQNSWRIGRLLFEGLTAFAADGSLRPASARAWEADATLRRYTFHLRSGLRWSDGEPLTAHDFVFAWSRVLDPSIAAASAGHLYALEAAEAVNMGTRPPRDLGVEAIDDTTLAVELEHPDPIFAMRTALPPLFPLPRHQVEEIGPQWPAGVVPVSNGPFQLKEWKADRHLIATRSETYWDRGRVQLEEVVLYPVQDPTTVYSLYRTGDLDWTNGIAADRARQLLSRGAPEIHVAAALQVYYLELNTRAPPLDDVRVRRALEMTLERAVIVEEFFGTGARPTRRFVNTSLPGWQTPRVQDGSDAEARRLLEEAGYGGGVGLPTLRFVYNSGGPHGLIAEFLQSRWLQKLGVRVDLEATDFATLLERGERGDYEILRSGWLADLPDAMEYLHIFRSGDTNNTTGWNDPAFDALIDAARSERDPARRILMLRDAEAILLDAVAVLPILEGVTVQLVKPYVQGIVPDLLDVVDWTGIRVDTAWRPR